MDGRQWTMEERRFEYPVPSDDGELKMVLNKIKAEICMFTV